VSQVLQARYSGFIFWKLSIPIVIKAVFFQKVKTNMTKPYVPEPGRLNQGFRGCL